MADYFDWEKLQSLTKDWIDENEFYDLPIDKIFDIIALKDRQEKDAINAASYTAAIGWSALLGAFGGEVEWQDLLPFKQADAKKEYLDKDTLLILKKLILDKQINSQCLSAIGAYIDDSFFEEIKHLR